MRIAIIGGHGDYGQELAKRLKSQGHKVTITGSKTSGVHRKVEHLGVDSETDHRHAIRRADIVLIPDNYENLPHLIDDVHAHGKDKVIIDISRLDHKRDKRSRRILWIAAGDFLLDIFLISYILTHIL